MLLWLALQEQTLEDVLAVFAQFDCSWLLLATAVYAANVLVRVMRWSRLRATIVEARFQVIGEVLLVGNAVNNILPARLGELFRADYGKRRLRQTRSALLATIVVERLADPTIVASCLACGALVLAPTLRGAGGTWRIIAFTVVASMSLLAVAFTTVSLLPRSERLWRRLPRFVRRRLADVVTALRDLRNVRKGPFVLLTLGVWSFGALALACVMRAGGVSFDFFELLLLLGLVNLSTLLPTAPAYLGSYQLACAVVFSALGRSSAHGIAAAIAAQAFLLLPVTIVGILVLIVRAIPPRRLSSAPAPAPASAPRSNTHTHRVDSCRLTSKLQQEPQCLSRHSDAKSGSSFGRPGGDDCR